MIPAAESWELLRRAGACSACTSPFLPLQTAWTLLEASGAAASRTDFCEPCWNARPAAEGVFWKSRIPEPKVRTELFDAAELFGALTRILEGGEAAMAGRERICYLLALFCARKRLLRLKGISREDGKEFLLFSEPRRRRVHRILSVDLTEEELRNSRNEMAEMTRMAKGVV